MRCTSLRLVDSLYYFCELDGPISCALLRRVKRDFERKFLHQKYYPFIRLIVHCLENDSVAILQISSSSSAGFSVKLQLSVMYGFTNCNAGENQYGSNIPNLKNISELEP